MKRLLLISFNLFILIFIVAFLIYNSRQAKLMSLENQFAFYQVKNGNYINLSKSNRMFDIKELELDDDPVFNQDDIGYYDWSKHEFSINDKEVISKLDKLLDTEGEIFVLVAQNKKEYYCLSWSVKASIRPPFIPILRGENGIYNINMYDFYNKKNKKMIREIIDIYIKFYIEWAR